MKVPSLIKDPPNHRHSLATPYIPQNISSILDVGGVSYKKQNGKWIEFTGAPKEVWGAAHVSNKKNDRPSIYTINVTRDYDHFDRKPDMYYDGLHIPFKDSTYDLVTSIDVFEHIPDNERTQVLSEMIRVAKRKVIVVFPFFSEGNKKMELNILEDMKQKKIQPKPSLQEHRGFELPKVSKIEAYLKSKKIKYKLTYGTPRPVMEKYYMFQNTVNALLCLPGVPKEVVARFLTIIMDVAGSVFSMSQIVKKKDAYRAIFSISK